MKNRSAISTGLLALVAVALYAFYAVRNPEHLALDDTTRQEAPGKFVRLSDGMTHYQFDGPDTGRVVLLAHGFSVPYYIWDSTANALANAGYRVLRYDAFGRGYSDRPDVDYTDKLYERQVGELLDSLHIVGPVDFGGVSFGGYVTGVYTGRHPERVRSLILVDPVAGKSASTSRPLDLPLIGPYIFQTMGVPRMPAGQASDFIDASRFPDWADRYKSQMRFKGFGHALLSTRVMNRGLDMDTLYERVAAGKFPVLLLWGVRDQTVPFALNAGVRKAIPSAEFHQVEQAAHLPTLERAAETNAIILEFLKQH